MPPPTRVDSAHVSSDVPKSASARKEAATTSGDLSDQDSFQLQAHQLAGHLRDRQRDLDRRESLINARIADLENELRSTRLWEQEQAAAYADRERDLQRRINELEDRAQLLAATVQASENDRRSAQRGLDNQATALETERERLSALKQEALELRLSAEEAWRLLSNHPSESETDQALSICRERIRDCFRHEQETLLHRETELHGLERRLRCREEEVRRREDELHEWLRRRRQELDEATADLTARQKRLDQREHALACRERTTG